MSAKTTKKRLSPERQAVYDHATSTYILEPAQTELLTQALVLLDQAAAADEELERIGSLFVTTSRGPAEHPLARLARNNRTAAAGILSRLGLLNVGANQS